VCPPSLRAGARRVKEAGMNHVEWESLPESPCPVGGGRILAALPIGACLVRPDTTVLTWNDHLARRTGHDASLVLGSPLTLHFPRLARVGLAERLDRLTEQDGAAVISSAAEPFLFTLEDSARPGAGCVKQHVEARVVSSNPRVVMLTVEFSAAPAPAEQRDHEGLLVEFAGDDAEELRNCRKELSKVRREFEESELAKDHLLANLGAEVSGPLAAVLGWGSVLDDDSLPWEARREALSAILEGGSRMQQTISAMLDIAAVQAGRTPLRPADFSPWEIAEGVAARHAGTARRKGVTLAVEAAGAVPEAACVDGGKLARVLDVLVERAVQTTSTGGVRVILSTEYPEACSTPSLLFEVWDTGSGLTRSQAAEAPDPLRRTGGASSGFPSETGLKLAMAHELARLIGASIAWSGGAGEGNRFTLGVRYGGFEAPTVKRTPRRGAGSLPVAPSVDDQTPAGDVRLDGASVLLVDSCATTAGIVRRVMSQAGAVVDTFADVDQAARAAGIAQGGKKPYDLALIDVGASGVWYESGETCARMLRSAGFAGRVLAIADDTLITSARRGPGEDLGTLFDGTAPRPVTRAELLAACARWLKPRGDESGSRRAA